MKRSPLKRKTPLKRGGRLKRSPLKRVSAKKAAWNRLYSKAKKTRIQDDGSECRRCGQHARLDGHHPHGQAGKNILFFVLVCRPCHDWIHSNPSAAREVGWLGWNPVYHTHVNPAVRSAFVASVQELLEHNLNLKGALEHVVINSTPRG